jgi:K+-sensing histidine kinase KdpD
VAHVNLEQRLAGSAILRYGFSVVAVAVALGLGLIFDAYGFRETQFPLFTLAIAFVTWYADRWSSILALVLSAILFNFFFTEPFYTLYISASDIPYFVIFVVWALIIAAFASARRSAERDLLAARHHLQSANKELESFAYSVSHDLRAPLRHTAGYAELLRRQASSVLDEKSLRFLDTIQESSHSRRGSGDRSPQDRGDRLCAQNQTVAARAGGAACNARIRGKSRTKESRTGPAAQRSLSLGGATFEPKRQFRLGCGKRPN